MYCSRFCPIALSGTRPTFLFLLAVCWCSSSSDVAPSLCFLIDLSVQFPLSSRPQFSLEVVRLEVFILSLPVWGALIPEMSLKTESMPGSPSMAAWCPRLTSHLLSLLLQSHLGKALSAPSSVPAPGRLLRTNRSSSVGLGTWIL